MDLPEQMKEIEKERAKFFKMQEINNKIEDKILRGGNRASWSLN
jgi:hypothetical protein